MSKKIKVAYLSHGIYYGGATTSLYLMLKSLKNNASIEKYLFSTSCKSDDMKRDFQKYCERVLITKVPIVHNDVFDSTPYYKFIFKRMESCEKLIKLLKQYSIDILHVNSSVLCLVHENVKKYTNVKIVTHVRETMPIYGNGFMRDFMINKIASHSDALIAISENETKPFIGHKNMHVIPNPFDFSLVKEGDGKFRVQNNITDDTVVIGMMGQFHKGKGHIDLLEALKTIVERKAIKTKFVFVLIGVRETPLWKSLIKSVLLREDYSKTVRRYIQNNNLIQYVRLIPYSYSVFNILASIDVLVRTSIAGDPWGRDIIEGMAFGKPIIATGESEYYVKPGITGYLVKPCNPIELAEAIVSLANDPAKRRLFGSNGSDQIRKMCDISEYGEKIGSVYESIGD
jgi:glycosyltransferase involved in cell wall biosynthesis